MVLDEVKIPAFHILEEWEKQLYEQKNIFAFVVENHDE